MAASSTDLRTGLSPHEEMEFSTFIKVKINQIALMSCRGYLIPPDERFGSGGLSILPYNYSYDDFKRVLEYYLEIYQDDPSEIKRGVSRVYTHAITKKKTAVYFVEVTKDSRTVPKASLVEAIGYIQANWRCNSTILIVPRPLAGRDAISDRLKGTLEVFEEKYLYATPIAHRLNQEMVRLTPENKEIFLRENAAELDKIPKMLLTDPNSVYYGFEIGDVIAIILYDPYTGGPSYRVSYRVVTAPPIYRKSSTPAKK